MKKLLFILLISLAFISCSESPTDVAKKFSENMSMGNLEKASKYIMPSKFKTKFNEFINFNGGVHPAQYPDYKFKAIKDSISGNQAWVTYITPMGEEDILILTKIDNEWKVSIDE